VSEVLRQVELLGGSDIHGLAKKLGVVPTKKLGENFVTDPNTIRRIVAAAKLVGHETVVEIGPGLGSLTLGLLEVAKRVVAVEIDPKLADELESTIVSRAPGAGSDFALVRADALRVLELPAAPQALVANLPYNISVPVLLHFFEQFKTLESGLVLVQAEVAHRLAATQATKSMAHRVSNWLGMPRLISRATLVAIFFGRCPMSTRRWFILENVQRHWAMRNSGLTPSTWSMLLFRSAAKLCAKR
jgi:16S rRNA (adenine1518-N6/adenine1519-N6)-dimethyltransferase